METLKFTVQGVVFEENGKFFLLPKNEGLEIASKIELLLQKKGNAQPRHAILAELKNGAENAYNQFGQVYLDALSLVVQKIELPEQVALPEPESEPKTEGEQGGANPKDLKKGKTKE